MFRSDHHIIRLDVSGVCDDAMTSFNVMEIVVVGNIYLRGTVEVTAARSAERITIQKLLCLHSIIRTLEDDTNLVS